MSCRDVSKKNPFVETLVKKPFIETLAKNPFVDAIVKNPCVETLVKSPFVETLVKNLFVETLVKNSFVETLVKNPRYRHRNIDANFATIARNLCVLSVSEPTSAVAVVHAIMSVSLPQILCCVHTSVHDLAHYAVICPSLSIVMNRRRMVLYIPN